MIPTEVVDDIDWESEYRSEVPIETKIRDKSSSAYKKLMGLLERHLDHNGVPVAAKTHTQYQNGYTYS